MNKVYTYGHSARSIEEFSETLKNSSIDLIVDLRKKPQSRYYPHFNKKNLEIVFQDKYVFGGDFLGGSPDFHNDLLDYIKNKGTNPENRLFQIISEKKRKEIFSKNEEFSNNEKRKFWITENYLHEYISKNSEKRALYFLTNLFNKFPDKKICFFCSEKEPTHCHRYHLLEKEWMNHFPKIKVQHLENKNNYQKQSLLF